MTRGARSGSAALAGQGGPPRAIVPTCLVTRVQAGNRPQRNPGHDSTGPKLAAPLFLFDPGPRGRIGGTARPRCDGRVLALNSYENRVYQVGRDEEPGGRQVLPSRALVDAAILEEHEFALELAARRDPGRGAVDVHRRAVAVRARGFPLRRVSAGRRPLAGTRHAGRPAMDGAVPRRASTTSGARGRFAHRPRAGLAHASAARPRTICSTRLDSDAPRAGVRIAGRRRAELVEQRFAEATPVSHAAPARRLPPGQRAVDRDGPAFRRPRRLHDGPGDAGPVDAAVGAARGDDAPSWPTCSRATASSPTSTTTRLR